MFTQRLKFFVPEEHEENIRYIDEFIETVKAHPGSCDEVWLTTAYGFPKLERHREIAEYQKTLAEKFRAAGIRVSMQIANTLGHGSYMVSRDCSGLSFEGSPAETMFGPDGIESTLCFCWNGKYFTEYYKKVMEYYAVIKPHRVWIDDDLRARNHKPVEYGCFCDACIQKFNAIYGFDFTRAELVYAINRNGIDVRDKWTRFIRQGLHDFTLTLVSEFVKHAPGTLFALQNGANGSYTGYGHDHLFEAMHRATGQDLGYRAGAGAYTDHEPSAFVTKARSVEYQNSLVPDYVCDLRPEIECLPDVAYGKSANGLAFETDLYFAYGATAMSYAMICRQYEPLSGYHAKEFAKFSQHRPYLQKLSQYNKRTAVSGVEYLLSKNAHLRPQSDDEPDFSYSDRHAFEGGFDPILGIPLSYRSNDQTKVYQLTERAVNALPNEEIQFLLTQPVFTDGKCISMLIEKGFDAFGIEAHAVPTVAVLEHFLPSPVNETLWGTKWGQTYYDHNGYAFLPKSDRVMPINEFIPTNPNIKAFFPDHAQYPFGLSAVIVTTTGGGKWAIFGNNPWSRTISFDRRTQILSAIDFISEQKSLKAYLDSPVQAIVRPRITPKDKTACVSLVTTTTGDSEQMTLVVRNPESEIFDFQNGETLIENLPFEKHGTDYRIQIPPMKGWSVATVFCR